MYVSGEPPAAISISLLPCDVVEDEQVAKVPRVNLLDSAVERDNSNGVPELVYGSGDNSDSDDSDDDSDLKTDEAAADGDDDDDDRGNVIVGKLKDAGLLEHWKGLILPTNYLIAQSKLIVV